MGNDMIGRVFAIAALAISAPVFAVPIFVLAAIFLAIAVDIKF